MSLVDRPAAKGSKIAIMQKLVIGFTGTRGGMTPIASARLAVLVAALDPAVAHHGDCVGADAGFHAEVTDWVPDCAMMVHPALARGMRDFRAYCTSRRQITHVPKPALQRNKDIVDAIDVLIAAPSSPREVLRSGTWATIRYARSVKRPIIMIYPDGRMEMDFPEDAQVPSIGSYSSMSLPRTGRGSLAGQLSGDFVDPAAMARALEAMDNAVKAASWTLENSHLGSFADMIRQQDRPEWVSERRSEDTSSDPS